VTGPPPGHVRSFSRKNTCSQSGGAAFGNGGISGPAVLQQKLAAGRRYNDERATARRTRAFHETAIAGFLPHREARTRRPPRVEKVRVRARLAGNDVVAQGSFGSGGTIHVSTGHVDLATLRGLGLPVSKLRGLTLPVRAALKRRGIATCGRLLDVAGGAADRDSERAGGRPRSEEPER